MATPPATPRGIKQWHPGQQVLLDPKTQTLVCPNDLFSNELLARFNTPMSLEEILTLAEQVGNARLLVEEEESASFKVMLWRDRYGSAVVTNVGGGYVANFVVL